MSIRKKSEPGSSWRDILNSKIVRYDRKWQRYRDILYMASTGTFEFRLIFYLKCISEIAGYYTYLGIIHTFLQILSEDFIFYILLLIL